MSVRNAVPTVTHQLNCKTAPQRSWKTRTTKQYHIVVCFVFDMVEKMLGQPKTLKQGKPWFGAPGWEREKKETRNQQKINE